MDRGKYRYVAIYICFRLCGRYAAGKISYVSKITPLPHKNWKKTVCVYLPTWQQTALLLKSFRLRLYCYTLMSLSLAHVSFSRSCFFLSFSVSCFSLSFSCSCFFLSFSRQISPSHSLTHVSSSLSLAHVSSSLSLTCVHALSPPLCLKSPFSPTHTHSLPLFVSLSCSLCPSLLLCGTFFSD